MTGNDEIDVPESDRVTHDNPEWECRHATSVRLALVFGGVAVVVFLLALWKFRPF